MHLYIVSESKVGGDILWVELKWAEFYNYLKLLFSYFTFVTKTEE